jgi:hypothetical protein
MLQCEQDPTTLRKYIVDMTVEMSFETLITPRIDHVLVDRRRNSSVIYVRSFKRADCDTNHYLVVAKVGERLAVSKKTTHSFHMQRFNLKNLNDVEVKE